MSQLTEVYSCIDSAESKSRKGELRGTILDYRRAFDLVNKLEYQGVSLEIVHAIKLLQHDIDIRIKELESLIEGQKPVNGNGAVTVTPGMRRNGSLASSAISSSKIRNWDNARSSMNNAVMGLPGDPLLASIFGRLQANLVNSICEQYKEEDRQIIEELNNRVGENLIKFKRELGLYEQKKSKDYSVRLEQAINENKKLSNQILKLRGRWDSLVESAKQRRSRQHED